MFTKLLSCWMTCTLVLIMGCNRPSIVRNNRDNDDKDDNVDRDSDVIDGVDLDVPYTVYSEGYLVSRPWHGYLFSAADSLGTQINPTDFLNMKEGETPCVNGNVVIDPEHKSFAMLGWNINQDWGEDTPVNARTVNSTGIEISVSNETGSTLRLQIDAEDADSNPAHRWCVKLENSIQQIPWSSFNTACWDNSGDFYDTSWKIKNIVLLVPGNPNSAIDFDFCLNSIAPYSD